MSRAVYHTTFEREASDGETEEVEVSYTYSGSTPPSLEHPGDPAEIDVVSCSGGDLTDAEVEAILLKHEERVAEDYADYDD